MTLVCALILAHPCCAVCVSVGLPTLDEHSISRTEMVSRLALGCIQAAKTGRGPGSTGANYFIFCITDLLHRSSRRFLPVFQCHSLLSWLPKSLSWTVFLLCWLGTYNSRTNPTPRSTRNLSVRSLCRTSTFQPLMLPSVDESFFLAKYLDK